MPFISRAKPKVAKTSSINAGIALAHKNRTRGVAVGKESRTLSALLPVAVRFSLLSMYYVLFLPPILIIYLLLGIVLLLYGLLDKDDPISYQDIGKCC